MHLTISVKRPRDQRILLPPSWPRSNVRAQLLPEAGATQERTLEAVSCSPMLGDAPPIHLLSKSEPCFHRVGEIGSTMV
jgi:hypothetical protein